MTIHHAALFTPLLYTMDGHYTVLFYFHFGLLDFFFNHILMFT